MRCTFWFGGVAASACLLMVSGLGFSTVPQAGSDDAFSPVAPAAAIDAALRSNLKLVQDWLKEGDFASASETAEGLCVLAQAYQFQSDQPDWRDHVAALREACSKLVAAARSKDAAGCTTSVGACESTLAELSRSRPAEAKAVARDFKPSGSTKTLMKLLDGTYAEAKGSKAADGLAQLAYTLAEGANIAGHVRRDDAWRDAARQARDMALRTAALAERDDFAGARAELKHVRERCEACHRAFKE